MAYKQKHPYLAQIWYMVKWKLTHGWKWFLLLLIVLVLASCGKKEEPVHPDVEYKENVYLDIAVENNGYYATGGDLEYHYADNGELDYIVYRPDVLWAFRVSDNYEGGVCLIQGTDLEWLQDTQEAPWKALEDGDTELALHYIRELSNWW